jgi:hypothetical protein
MNLIEFSEEVAGVKEVTSFEVETCFHKKSGSISSWRSKACCLVQCCQICKPKTTKQFGYIFENLGMENVGIFHDRLGYFAAVWYRLCTSILDCLRPFGMYTYFNPFWYVAPRKVWQPWFRRKTGKWH